MLINRSFIIKRMLDSGIIDSKQFLTACQQCQNQGGRIFDVITDQAGMTGESIIRFFHEKLNYDFIRLSDLVLNPRIVTLVPPDLLIDHLIIPAFKIQNYVYLAVANPLDLEGLSEIEKYIGKENKIILSSKEQIIGAISKYIFEPKILAKKR